jgi:hypothetical protein
VALIIGTRVRFRPDAASRRGIEPDRLFTLRRIYRRPGDPALWAVIAELPPGKNHVRLSELH